MRTVNVGRPRTVIGAYRMITVRTAGRGYTAAVRYRDVDGRLRPVTASGTSCGQLADRAKCGREKPLAWVWND